VVVTRLHVASFNSMGVVRPRVDDVAFDPQRARTLERRKPPGQTSFSGHTLPTAIGGDRVGRKVRKGGLPMSLHSPHTMRGYHHFVGAESYVNQLINYPSLNNMKSMRQRTISISRLRYFRLRAHLRSVRRVFAHPVGQMGTSM